MIPHRKGWTRQHDGESLVLHHRGDPSLGFLRYVERLPPATPLELLAAQLAHDPHFEVDTISTPEEVITQEGEYAALATVHGRLEGHWVRRDFGWVFGDAHVARLSSLTPYPDLAPIFASTLRELVLADEQHLGVRRRRFRHQAPPGWTTRTRGFGTTIYGAPDGGAQIEVSAAVPSWASIDEVESQIAATGATDGFTVDALSAAEEITAVRGLEGRVWELACRQGSTTFLRRVATFVDGRYLYTLRLDTLTGDERDLFDAVVRSVEPIPQPSHRRHAVAVAAFDHWC